jgi:hypothetical protein
LRIWAKKEEFFYSQKTVNLEHLPNEKAPVRKALWLIYRKFVVTIMPEYRCSDFLPPSVVSLSFSQLVARIGKRVGLATRWAPRPVNGRRIILPL